MKVFISHSSTDKWIARQISTHLADIGIDSFLDEKEIETGDSIDEAIQTHLADCDELLMLLSPASLESDWVMIEIGGAMALKKRLIPILLHVGPNELPDALGNGLARDINEIDRYYAEVRERNEKSEPGVAVSEKHSAENRRVSQSRTFEVGDLVRLPREVPASTYARDGTDVGWNSAMERFLSAETRVSSVDSEWHAVRVNVDNGAWVWLMDWLDPVAAEDQPASAPAPSRLKEGLQ